MNLSHVALGQWIPGLVAYFKASIEFQAIQKLEQTKKKCLFNLNANRASNAKQVLNANYKNYVIRFVRYLDKQIPSVPLRWLMFTNKKVYTTNVTAYGICNLTRSLQKYANIRAVVLENVLLSLQLP